MVRRKRPEPPEGVDFTGFPAFVEDSSLDYEASKEAVAAWYREFDAWDAARFQWYTDQGVYPPHHGLTLPGMPWDPETDPV